MPIILTLLQVAMLVAWYIWPPMMVAPLWLVFLPFIIIACIWLCIALLLLAGITINILSRR